MRKPAPYIQPTIAFSMGDECNLLALGTETSWVRYLLRRVSSNDSLQARPGAMSDRPRGMSVLHDPAARVA